MREKLIKEKLEALPGIGDISSEEEYYYFDGWYDALQWVLLLERGEVD